ncbi:MAG TPA: hypothetical protein EYG82_00955 [Sulfurovum sp.]|nr:hypothetical protein [Sulfurovum sp.]
MKLIKFKKIDILKKKITVIGIYILSLMLLVRAFSLIFKLIKYNDPISQVIFIIAVFILLSFLIFGLKISRWLILLFLYATLVHQTIFLMTLSLSTLNSVDILSLIMTDMMMLTTVWLLVNEEARALFAKGKRFLRSDWIVLIMGICIGIYTSLRFIFSAV